VSRYIHLNPVSKRLVQLPEDWQYSSYLSYIKNKDLLGKYLSEISINTQQIYRRFVVDRIDYQRKLKEISKAYIDQNP